jgi:hypothetical protein
MMGGGIVVMEDLKPGQLHSTGDDDLVALNDEARQSSWMGQ